MPVVEEKVRIAQPPEVVFDYLSRAENISRWDTSIVAAEQVGNGPLAIGTRWNGKSKIMGREFDWVTEITDVAAPRRMTSRSIEGKLTFTVRYDLEPDATGGTELTYHVEAESGLGGVFGRLGDPLVKTVQGRTVRASLARLSQVLGAATAA